MEKKDQLMFCDNGACVDVSRVKCEEKFDDLGDIIACEQLKEMEQEAISL